MPKKKKKVNQITCIRDMCLHKGEPQPETNFYKCNNEVISKFGRYPICRDCLAEIINTQSTDMLFKILKDMDIAFVPEVWDKCRNNYPDNPFAHYVRYMNGMIQYKGKRFDIKQTIMTPEEIGTPVSTQVVENQKPADLTELERRNELIEFWGTGYTKEEYEAMQKKYDEIAESYATPTKMHVENLKKYCKYSVKEDLALANNNPTDAKTWGGLAASAASAAKINVNQLSAADLQGGVNSFSEVVQAVESAVDIIPILPRFKYRPNDAIDLVIFEYINYARSLHGLPDLPYSEIYKFYDDKKAEFIRKTGDPYGFYKDDPTENNRQAVQQIVHALDNVESESLKEEEEQKQDEEPENGTQLKS